MTMITLPQSLRDAVDDWHTHNQSARRAIINLPDPGSTREPGALYSAGIYPWLADSSDLDERLARLRSVAGEPDVVAIGEAGLDRLRGPGLDVQMPLFISQARIADAVGKPLIIHAVRTIPEIISAHKSLKPRVAWIIHGFRGSPEAAKQLLARPGIYISIGAKYRPEAVELIPADRLLRETDQEG